MGEVVTVERTKAVARAIAERTKLLDERFPGYQTEVLRRIVNIVSHQGQLANDAARRKAIRLEITALADLVVEHDRQEGLQ